MTGLDIMMEKLVALSIVSVSGIIGGFFGYLFCVIIQAIF